MFMHTIYFGILHPYSPVKVFCQIDFWTFVLTFHRDLLLCNTPGKLPIWFKELTYTYESVADVSAKHCGLQGFSSTTISYASLNLVLGNCWQNAWHIAAPCPYRASFVRTWLWSEVYNEIGRCSWKVKDSFGSYSKQLYATLEDRTFVM